MPLKSDWADGDTLHGSDFDTVTTQVNVLSDTVMGAMFDAQKTQRDTVLLASNDFIAVDTLEIGATSTSLEIPATSSLEILHFLTPNSTEAVTNFATLTNAVTMTGKTVSDTFVGKGFDASVVQRDTTLLASNDFTALEALEIGAATSLEIPATTSLEIIRYVTPASVDNLYSKTLVSPVINGASVTADIVGINNVTSLGSVASYWLNGFLANAWVFFLNMQAVSAPTSPTPGAIQYDGTAFYASAATSTPQVMDAEQFATLTSAYTLTSQTAAQKLFNTSTNGRVTLPIGTYFFECFFDLSSMSATSGAFGWDLTAGTATIAGIKWYSEANKAALATAASPQSTVNTAANTAICTATTNTVGWAKITGKVRISVAGTVTPQVSLGVAAAAIVSVDSYFRIWSVGSNTVTNVGNWS